MVELRKEAIAQVMITQGSSLRMTSWRRVEAVAAEVRGRGRRPRQIRSMVELRKDGTGQTRGGREDRDLHDEV